MKSLALITIHGMGLEDKNYFKNLEKHLKKSLNDQWEEIYFRNIKFASILQGNQNNMLDAMQKDTKNPLNSKLLRRFFVNGFSDATSLEHSPRENGEPYIDVQKAVQMELLAAYDENPNMEIVIVAQSLGCQVISNYLWDAAGNKNIFDPLVVSNTFDFEKLEFLKLRSLRHFVTTGCNIPLFIAGLNNKKCFKLPNPKFQWDNYYDPDDILGWPLNTLDESYSLVNDHDIEVGGLLTSWSPLSHLHYWDDESFIRPLSALLKSYL